MGKPMMIMTPKRAFVLSFIAKGPTDTLPVCKAAQAKGLSPSYYLNGEWADRTFRELREAGLIEKTGEKSGVWLRAIHQITDKGRALLSEMQEKDAKP